MTWNYRVVRHSESSYSVHEIFYDDDGNITAFAADGAPFGESVDELEADVQAMREAFLLPVLVIKEIRKKINR